MRKGGQGGGKQRKDDAFAEILKERNQLGGERKEGVGGTGRGKFVSFILFYFFYYRGNKNFVLLIIRLDQEA